MIFSHVPSTYDLFLSSAKILRQGPSSEQIETQFFNMIAADEHDEILYSDSKSNDSHDSLAVDSLNGLDLEIISRMEYICYYDSKYQGNYFENQLKLAQLQDGSYLRRRGSSFKQGQGPQVVHSSQFENPVSPLKETPSALFPTFAIQVIDSPVVTPRSSNAALIIPAITTNVENETHEVNGHVVNGNTINTANVHHGSPFSSPATTGVSIQSGSHHPPMLRGSTFRNNLQNSGLTKGNASNSKMSPLSGIPAHNEGAGIIHLSKNLSSSKVSLGGNGNNNVTIMKSISVASLDNEKPPPLKSPSLSFQKQEFQFLKISPITSVPPQAPQDLRIVPPSLLALLANPGTIARMRYMGKVVSSFMGLIAHVSLSVDRLDLVPCLLNWIITTTDLAVNEAGTENGTIKHQLRYRNLLQGVIERADLCWVFDGFLDLLLPIFKTILNCVDPSYRAVGGRKDQSEENEAGLSSKLDSDNADALKVYFLPEFILFLKSVATSFVFAYVLQGELIALSKINQDACFKVVWEDLGRVEKVNASLTSESASISVANGDLEFFESCLQFIDQIPFDLELELTVQLIHCRVLLAILIARVKPIEGKPIIKEQIAILNSILDEDIGNLGICLACVEGLGKLAANQTNEIKLVVDILTDMLTKPSHLFFLWSQEYGETGIEKCSILEECLSHTIAAILEIFSSDPNKDQESSSMKKTILFACINIVHSTYQSLSMYKNDEQIKSSNHLNDKHYDPKGYAAQIQIFGNSVSLISHLSRVLKPKETVDMAIPAIVRRLEENNSENKYLWRALGNIGMTENAEIFKSVLSFTLGSIGNTGKVSKAAVILARMPGRPLGLVTFFLEKVLFLFLEKAGLMHKTCDIKLIPNLLDLCNLIRVLFENDELTASVPGNYDLCHNLRNMWFYLILFVLGPDGSWPRDWRLVLKTLARKVPPLVIDPTARSLDVNLSSDSILVATFSEEVIGKIKNLLVSYLPAKVNEVKLLSWTSSVYLLSFYQVELLRLRHLSIDHLFSYIVDDRLQTPELYPLAEALVDSILKENFKDSFFRTAESGIVNDHICSLLIFAAHRIPAIRAFACRWILNILSSLPHMLFCRHNVYYMLDLLRFLDNQKVGHTEDHLQAAFGSWYIFISASEAHESAFGFYNLAKEWIARALEAAPSETIPMLQNYISEISTVSPWIGSRQMGKTGAALPQEELSSSFLMALFQKFYMDPTTSANMIRHSNKRVKLLGEVKGLIILQSSTSERGNISAVTKELSKTFAQHLRKLYQSHGAINFSSQLYQSLSKAAALVILNELTVESELIMLICHAPKIFFTAAVVEVALELLAWVMAVRPTFVTRILACLNQTWESIAIMKIGIYAETKAHNPFNGSMTYGEPRPMEKNDSCEPHSIWIQFMIERFKFDKLHGSECLYLYSSFVRMACQTNFRMSFNAREARIELATLAIKVALELSARGVKTALFLWTDVFNTCVDLFAIAPTFGKITKVYLTKMLRIYTKIKNLKIDKMANSLTTLLLKSAFITFRESERLEFSDVQQLLILLFEQEIHRTSAWLNPVLQENDNTLPPPVNERQVKWATMVKIAWRINPLVAIVLKSRFNNSTDLIEAEICEVARRSNIKLLASPEAVSIFLRSFSKTKIEANLRQLLYWCPIPPATAIQIVSLSQTSHPWVVQYAIRSLEDFPIDVVFFYIPQLVQALRYDVLGYIEKYILEAAKTSQYFAHQIIWNMDANKFKDDMGEVPDSLKPVFDRITQRIVQGLTGADKEFYEREFAFFKEITDISGKLKPLVISGASKTEKKRKIDEEMVKIRVDVGVYLPTNPERTVVDIDKLSGRPLQSHAKAPYMATFMVRNTNDQHAEVERMASIFKVGDDCRQDVLALQLISVFQSIFQSVGLDLYTFPYRVVATASGCGVIEVIPQSISRDMMGREKVNSLYDWFLAEFGSENSIRFKTARLEFIKSLAAYSIIMFLLQIKDRHNGNIMFDRHGHLIHIDFGFMLSIAPGGGILEVAPFKLTSEMIQVMGGDATSPGYTLFSELCIKGYLAARLYSNEIISLVQLMLDSGLPCFKGDWTIKKLKERFQLDKSDRGACEFMLSCIRQSHENTRSGLYDLFQYAQNGIPFK